jgi:hypothetical protein
MVRNTAEIVVHVSEAIHRSLWTGCRGRIRHGRQRVVVEFHDLDIRGTEGDRQQGLLNGYPGGIVDRVVELSNGEYEVHNIGVNWPHHIFVNKDFRVVGAD